MSGTTSQNERRPFKIRGDVLDKLKRKSILNCELFREMLPDLGENGMPKSKTMQMTERISHVLGIRLTHQMNVPIRENKGRGIASQRGTSSSVI